MSKEVPDDIFDETMGAVHPDDLKSSKVPRIAHSKSEYKRLKTMGANVIPPLPGNAMYLGRKCYEAYKEAHLEHGVYQHMDDWDDLWDDHKVAWAFAAMAVLRANEDFDVNTIRVSPNQIKNALAHLRGKGT